LILAASGKVRSAIERQPLEAINDVFDRMRRGEVNGRVVLAIGD
jgi:propanol-preferring alcohol dehydrogenase